ncbi:MAG: Druantia anti-phage system protein DruA, partial [Egibacteraceae bacterium]
MSVTGLGIVGETVRCVATERDRWVAVLGFGSAALACAPRGRWVGWSKQQQLARLRCVVSNQRFCVLPEGRRPDLACAVLARALRRLSSACRASRWRTFWSNRRARTVCSRSKATSRRPWRQSGACSSRSSFPPCHTEAGRGHPRVERRSVQAAVTCAEQVGFGARSSGVLPSCVRCPTWTA